MEKIVCNPGLQHLVEKVFWNLDTEDLKICAEINQSCKQILQNPIFCLRKFENLSMKNQNDWIKVIQSVNNIDKGIAIICYLKWNMEKDAFVDLPCYSSSVVQDEFNKRIKKSCMKWPKTDEDTEIVKVLAPLTKNHNAPTNVGVFTPIYEAAFKGHTEIVKILAPLTDNPNAQDYYGKTPIHLAARIGHTEIVQILVPLTDKPNAPDECGMTPIYLAGKHRHTKIVGILAPLTNNPNVPNMYRDSQSYLAVLKGHTEIVKIL